MAEIQTRVRIFGRIPDSLRTEDEPASGAIWYWSEPYVPPATDGEPIEAVSLSTVHHLVDLATHIQERGCLTPSEGSLLESGRFRLTLRTSLVEHFYLTGSILVSEPETLVSELDRWLGFIATGLGELSLVVQAVTMSWDCHGDTGPHDVLDTALRELDSVVAGSSADCPERAWVLGRQSYEILLRQHTGRDAYRSSLDWNSWYRLWIASEAARSLLANGRELAPEAEAVVTRMRGLFESLENSHASVDLAYEARRDLVSLQDKVLQFSLQVDTVRQFHSSYFNPSPAGWRAAWDSHPTAHDKISREYEELYAGPVRLIEQGLSQLVQVADSRTVALADATDVRFSSRLNVRIGRLGWAAVVLAGFALVWGIVLSLTSPGDSDRSPTTVNTVISITTEVPDGS